MQIIDNREKWRRYNAVRSAIGAVFAGLLFVGVILGLVWYPHSAIYRDRRGLESALRTHQAAGTVSMARSNGSRGGYIKAPNPQIVRISYFPNGRPSFSRTHYLNDDGTVGSQRYWVSSGAKGGGTYLSNYTRDPEQVRHWIRQVAAWTQTLPPDDPPRRTADLLLVSFREPTGAWTTRRYSVRRPPDGVVRYYRLLASLDKYQEPPPFVASAPASAAAQEDAPTAAKGKTV